MYHGIHPHDTFKVKNDTTLSYEFCSNIAVLQTFTLIQSPFAFKFINTFGFAILGKGSIPQSDITFIPTKHLGKGDPTYFHKDCLNIQLL